MRSNLTRVFVAIPISSS